MLKTPNSMGEFLLQCLITKVVGPRLIDGRVGVELFGVGGSRSARTLHYFALLFLGGGFWGGVRGG